MRLTFSVGNLRSRFRVIGTEKWNGVMTVSAGYPGQPGYPALPDTYIGDTLLWSKYSRKK